MNLFFFCGVSVSIKSSFEIRTLSSGGRLGGGNMNNTLLIIFLLSFCQTVFAQNLDVGPRYEFKGRSFKLDPYRPQKAREFSDKSIDSTIPPNFPMVVDLSSLQSVVKNQGDRGSCAFFTTTALLESLVKERQGIEIDISKEYLIWKLKADMGLDSRTDGSFADQDVTGFAQGGILLERDFPFQPSWFAPKMPCAKYKGIEASAPVACFAHHKPAPEVLNKVISASAFTPEIFSANFSKIIEIMAKSKHAVIIGVPVYLKGWNEKTGEVVLTDEMFAECNAKPKLCGGHSILLTGYDQNKRVFMFKNSWDVVWGKNGYGTIPFDYVAKYAFDKMVSGSLKAPLPIPSDYFYTTYKSSYVNSLKADVVSEASGKSLSLLANLSITNFENRIISVSAFLVTSKTGDPISDDNAELVPVLPELQKENGLYVKDVFYKVFGPEGKKITIDADFKIPDSLIDRSLIQGKDLYLKVASSFYSDQGAGWFPISRYYQKLDFSF